MKSSTETLNKLKANGFQASTISTYDFSALYTTLPHDLIKNQLVDLIENTFRRKEVLYLACNVEHAIFASKEHKKYSLWTCQKVPEALVYLLDNIYTCIRFGSKLYRQKVGIPIRTIYIFTSKPSLSLRPEPPPCKQRLQYSLQP